MLYAGAKLRTQGIILTFNSKHGPLSYPCDKYSNWQANLRAIALSLEALRAVDRYGVTHPEKCGTLSQLLSGGSGPPSPRSDRRRRCRLQTPPDGENDSGKTSRRLNDDRGGDRGRGAVIPEYFISWAA